MSPVLLFGLDWQEGHIQAALPCRSVLFRPVLRHTYRIPAHGFLFLHTLQSLLYIYQNHLSARIPVLQVHALPLRM